MSNGMPEIVSSSPAMDLQGAAVLFGPREGLRDITMSIARGERLALMGPSGSGKTSLLRAIAGLDQFAAGKLAVDGVNMTSAPPEQRGCVYVHQSPALFPHLSVLDNVAFPIVLRGKPRADARDQAMGLLTQLQLSSLAQRSPARLSGGERQRTALARALAAEPALLLLDEPFAALDPSLRADVREYVLAALAAPGGPAVIVVTHDVDEAAQMGTRLVVLLHGTIAQDAPIDAALQRPATVQVARLLGVPNVVSGHRDGRGHWTSEIGILAAVGAAGPACAVGWTDMIHLQDIVKGDNTCGARGIITSVEHRGLGRVVRVRVGEHNLLARADAGSAWRPGDEVGVTLSARAHIVACDSAPPHADTSRDDTSARTHRGAHDV